jgi:hypothetical protein
MQNPNVNLILFLEKLVNSKSSAKVITVIPLSLGSSSQDGDNSPARLARILNSAIVDSVIAHLEELADSRTVQALEYHLSLNDISMSELCIYPQKISDALYDIFSDSADIIIEKIIECAFKTLGFKWSSTEMPSSKRTKLATALEMLKRKALGANYIRREDEKPE